MFVQVEVSIISWWDIKKRKTVIGCKKVESFLFVVMCVIITPYSLLTGSLAIELLRSL